MEINSFYVVYVLYMFMLYGLYAFYDLCVVDGYVNL